MLADGSGDGKGFVGGGSGDGLGTGVSGGIGFGSGSGGCDTGVIDVMRAGSAPRELCRAGPGSRLCPSAGDEFAVLAPETAPDSARTLATRLLDQMTQQVSVNRTATASIGVATFDPARNASVTADSFMRKADAA